MYNIYNTHSTTRNLDNTIEYNKKLNEYIFLLIIKDIIRLIYTINQTLYHVRNYRYY
jgi:hypothetical protein